MIVETRHGASLHYTKSQYDETRHGASLLHENERRSPQSERPSLLLQNAKCGQSILSDHIDAAIDFAIGGLNANHVDT